MKTVLAVLALAACSPFDPTPQAAADPRPQAPPIPYGRWTSPTHCLVLLENGDFELVDKQSSTHGKTVVYGAAKQIANGDGTHFDLAVDKIWQARWVSSCRKHVASAQNLNELTSAGVTWRPGAHQTVRIVATAGGRALEVCAAKECMTLAKDDEAPLVDADWRIPDDAVAKLPADVPRRIDLDAQHAVLSLRPARPADSWPTAYAETRKIEVLGHDRFRVTLAATFNADDARLAIWGTPLVKDTTIVLALHRLAGERLEACLGKRCAIYTRRWDTDAYDVR